VPDDPVGTKVEQCEGHRKRCRRDGDEGCAGASPSDNGPEFVAKGLRKWLAGAGNEDGLHRPGSPWENGYCESFQLKAAGRVPERRDLLLDEQEIRVLAERWRVHFNTVRHTLRWVPATGTRSLGDKSLGYGEVETARASHFSTPDCAIDRQK